MDVALRNLVLLEQIEKHDQRKKKIRNKYSLDWYNIDDLEFQRRYRLSKKCVSELLPFIEDKIRHATHLNEALTPLEQLLVALRFYATGTHQLVIGDLINISQPTVSRVVHKVSQAIAELRPHFIKMPESEEECLAVSEDFFRIANFPNVIGALDCSHIPILSPGGNDAERFRNRKGFFSLNIQTVVSSELLIQDVVARWPGSTHDSTIFSNSRISERMKDAVHKKYHLLGDSGYPCHPSIMTPLSQPSTEAEQRYNVAQILTRNPIERSYGVQKRRFPCLQSTLKCAVDNVPAIIVACCVLHNLALTLGDPEPPLDPEVQSYIKGFTDECSGNQVNYRNAFQTQTQDTAAGYAKRRLLIQRFF